MFNSMSQSCVVRFNASMVTTGRVRTAFGAFDQERLSVDFN